MAHDLDPSRPLAGRDGEPAFDQPWQVEALALAGCLTERGVIDPAAWAAALGAALRDAEAGGAPDTGETYYRAVLGALERLAGAQGLIDQESIERRAEAWRRAYLRTPHGRPVALEAGGDRTP